MNTALPDLQTQYQSLTDRLNAIDSAYQKILPTSNKKTMEIGRGVGENPLNVVLSMLNSGQQYNSYRDPIESEKNNLLKMITDQADKDQQQKNWEKEYALKSGGINELKVNPDGSLSFNTQEPSDTALTIKAVMEGNAKLKDLPPTMKAKVIAGAERAGIDLPSEKAQEQSDTSNLIQGLKSLYYGGEGQGDDLSLGRVGGFTTGVKNWFSGGEANVNANTYNSARKGFVRKIMDMVGEKGVMTDVDAERLANILPKTSEGPNAAKSKWDFVEKALKWKYENPNKLIPITEKEMNVNTTSSNGRPPLSSFER